MLGVSDAIVMLPVGVEENRIVERSPVENDGTVE